jgi:hypothetical protein
MSARPVQEDHVLDCQLSLLGSVLDCLLIWFRRRGFAEATIDSKISAAAFLVGWLLRRHKPNSED